MGPAAAAADSASAASAASAAASSCEQDLQTPLSQAWIQMRPKS